MGGILGDPVEIRADGVAEHGERDEGLALKKHAAKFLLQRNDGIGQRGLGNAAAFGRAGEATLLAKRQKVADVLHLHVSPRGINRASTPKLPSAPVSKCEVVHTEWTALPVTLPTPASQGRERLQGLIKGPLKKHFTSICGMAAIGTNGSAHPSGTCAGLADSLQVVESFRYLLTDRCQFDILQSSPGWRGPNAIRPIETA